jgi:hypothetical protein
MFPANTQTIFTTEAQRTQRTQRTQRKALDGNAFQNTFHCQVTKIPRMLTDGSNRIHDTNAPKFFAFFVPSVVSWVYGWMYMGFME